MTHKTIRPRWASIKSASIYSGICRRLLHEHAMAGTIRSSLVRKQGARRGMRLIDLHSLDEFIERGVGKKMQGPELNFNREGDQQ